jgi:di/tricarboxylate transporter
MTTHQIIALAVLVVVVGALAWGKYRSDVIALAGAAALLALGVVRPVEVQSAFASPAIIALASLFVIAYAMELSGLLGLIIRAATRLCRRLGAFGLWIFIGLSGAASAFLNNTPIVILAAPVVRDVAKSINQSPKRFLIPLSYATIMGGACTLIGTSTNLLVSDMARNSGQPAFSLFEVTPVGLTLAIVGSLYLILVGDRILTSSVKKTDAEAMADAAVSSQIFKPVQALASLLVFSGVVLAAALDYAPIAAAAFSGAVLLVLMNVISADEAYKGLRPEILLLIAGMVVIGLSLQVTGLASATTNALAENIKGLSPILALALLYGMTLLLTEILSNAAVAVLVTPLAVALAESLGVNPRPFLVSIMMAASAAFATPFGYQTNVITFQIGGYSYMDFVRVGIPLNLITWIAGVIVIPIFFPF